MATFQWEMNKIFEDHKTVDSVVMGGIDGYKAIHYACNWLSERPPKYVVHISKMDKNGLYRYYCAISKSVNGDYLKLSYNSKRPNGEIVNPLTGRTITPKKTNRR